MASVLSCPRCRHENPPGAKFCIECASPFQPACGRCGTRLPPAAKFCPDRVTVFQESVAVIRRLLAGEPVDHRGQLFQLEKAVVRPAARVPFYVGGHAEGALRRAGKLADGWIMSPFGTVRDFPRLWGAVQDAARAAGRNPDALVAGRLVYVAVDDDRDRARDALRQFLHGYYGARFDVDQHAVFGPAREVAARLGEHVEAGVTKLMLGVPSLDLAHLRRVAHEVAPALRARSVASR